MNIQYLGKDRAQIPSARRQTFTSLEIPIAPVARDKLKCAFDDSWLSLHDLGHASSPFL
jgi:hypothetical protein